MLTYMNSVTVKVKSILDKEVELILNDGQKLFWQREKLPENISEGQELILILSQEKEEEKKIAHKILQEIFNVNPQNNA